MRCIENSDKLRLTILPIYLKPMAKTPWTDSDPQPSDLEAELDRARSDQIEIREGNPDAKFSILVSIEGDDAKRLEQIASKRGQQPGEVVSELLRSAS